jgi:hypothetical protein
VQRKYALPILIFVLLTVAVFFLIREWRHSQAAWGYIPGNASAVLTSDRMQDSAFVYSDAFIQMKEFPIFQEASESLSLLYWIVRDKPIVDRTLQNKTLTFSFHPRTSGNLGIILYVPLEKETEKNWWKDPNRADIRVLRHTFQNTSIVDINNTQSRPVCSYIITDKYLIVSQYGELIEDVVRQMDNKTELTNLRNEFERTNDAKYSLNLYLKKGIWNDLFFKPLTSQGTLSEFISLFPDMQDYHLIPQEDSRINFMSLGSKKDENYVTEWVEKQKGSAFTNHQYIPQQTALFFRIASRDSAAFRKNFIAWHSDYQHPAWDKLSYHIGKQRQELVNNVGSELILCQIEGNNSISEGKLALIEYSNYDRLRPLLTKLARLANTETNVALDQYQGYDLYSIPIPEFPSGLYGSLFRGFPRTYISYVAPYLVLSNSSQALRNYISDYENNISWKQSPELDSILLNSSEPAQVSLVASPRKVSLRSPSAISNSLFASKIESVVMQCYYNSRQSYPFVSIIPRKRLTSDKVLNRTFLAGQIEWKSGNDTLVAISQRQGVGSAHLLLTDPAHTLVRPNASYDKLSPLAKLDGPLIVNPYRVDFLNIGRPQLVLATPQTLYTLDEDEQGFVTSIPTPSPSGLPIKNLFRIEGGAEGSSRFIILDKKENIYLWERVNATPMKINRYKTFSDVQTPIVSLNQLGSRYLLITQRNGLIYLVKEDGLVKQGFPVDLLTRTQSAFTWSQNEQTAQPELVGVTGYGELVRIDLSGKIVERRQLYRPVSSSTFKTLYDTGNLDWLLVRTSHTKIAILNKLGEELFEIGNILPPYQVQYHYFGVDNRFISISSGGFTSIFDMTGRRLGDKPVRSDLPVQLAYQPSYYKIFVFGHIEDKYQTWTIKIR